MGGFSRPYQDPRDPKEVNMMKNTTINGMNTYQALAGQESECPVACVSMGVVASDLDGSRALISTMTFWLCSSL